MSSGTDTGHGTWRLAAWAMLGLGFTLSATTAATAGAAPTTTRVHTGKQHSVVTGNSRAVTAPANMNVNAAAAAPPVNRPPHPKTGTGTGTGTGAAGNANNMHAVLTTLRQARALLEGANHDYDGYRAKAVGEISHAIRELEHHHHAANNGQNGQQARKGGGLLGAGLKNVGQQGAGQKGGGLLGAGLKNVGQQAGVQPVAAQKGGGLLGAGLKNAGQNNGQGAGQKGNGMREPQAQSDAQLKQAGQLLVGLSGHIPNGHKAAHHIQNAINDLHTALKIR